MIAVRPKCLTLAGFVFYSLAFSLQSVFGQQNDGGLSRSVAVSSVITARVKLVAKMHFTRRTEEIISVCGFEAREAGQLRLAARGDLRGLQREEDALRQRLENKAVVAPAGRLEVLVDIDELKQRMVVAANSPNTLLAKMTNRLATKEQSERLAEHDKAARLSETTARVKLLISYIERSIALVSTQRDALESMLVERANDQATAPKESLKGLVASTADEDLLKVLDVDQLRLVRQLLQSAPFEF